MFCDSCGAELPSQARFCWSCGRAIGTGATRPMGMGRVARNLQVLAILWLVYSVFHLVIAGASLVLVYTAFSPSGPLREISPRLPSVFQSLLWLLGVFLLAQALAGIAAGWGLMDRQSWARWLAILLAFLALPGFPIGTALGIYTLWVLLSRDAHEEYRRLARAA